MNAKDANRENGERREKLALGCGRLGEPSLPLWGRIFVVLLGVWLALAVPVLAGDLWVVSTNVWPGASDSNNGLTSNTAWATFTHVNLGGSHTTDASPTLHVAGTFNAALGSKYTIDFPGWTSSSGAPWIIQSEGTTAAAITNSPQSVNEIRLNGLSWGKITGMSFSSNAISPTPNSALNFTGCTNIEIAYCYFLSNSAPPVLSFSSQSGAQGECHQIWIHNCVLSNVLGNLNANCSDGDASSDMIHIGSGFNSSDQSGGFIIGPSNQFYFDGHAAIEMNGPSNRVTGNFFLNYPWQLMTNWVSCSSGGGYMVTNYIYAGGRILGPGGRCCSNTICESNIIAYCGWALDQPGAEHWEQAGSGISRFEQIFGSAGLGIFVDTESVTGGSSCGSNAFYHESIGLCGSNITYYSSGQMVQIPYAIYQAGMGFSGSSNNAIIDCIMYHNYVSYVSIIGGGQTFAGNIQDWRGNITNVNPSWVSEANSIDTLLPNPVVYPNFGLQGISVAINAGVWPGVITSTTGSGTSFQSTNAWMFSAGQGAASFTMAGDTIELANGQVTTIQSIVGNTITVSPGVSWTNNMGYDIVYANGQPTIGANDYGYGPTITLQPMSQTVSAGANATFTVAATDAPTTATLYYQWSFNTVPLAGATATSYTVISAETINAGNYQVLVTNAYGSVESAIATLNVTETGAPSITLQPVSQVAVYGTPALFTVAATGAPTLTYQWYLNSGAIAGATATALAIPSAKIQNAGSYDVIVANGSGNAVSGVAVLGVNYGLQVSGGNTGLQFIGGTNILVNGGVITN